MNGRLALLGVMLATMPLAVDLPGRPDSARGGVTTVEVAGGGGQFAIVSRGCNGEIYHVTHNQLRSGALVIEHRFPEDVVIGVRAGSVQTRWHHPVSAYNPVTYLYYDSTYVSEVSNAYVNPYAGWETRYVGADIGWLQADQPFLVNTGGYYYGGDFQRYHGTFHVRVGPEDKCFTIRWMEDLPLESEGHLTMEAAVKPTPRTEAGVFTGLAGPFDGGMIGLRGRVWLTPAAMLQIKGEIGSNGEGGLYGSVGTRFRTPH